MGLQGVPGRREAAGASPRTRRSLAVASCRLAPGQSVRVDDPGFLERTATERYAVRVAADYSAFPIWPNATNTRGVHIPEDLNLSQGLLADLEQWAEVHDRARTAPRDFAWDERVASERIWIEQGRSLAERVQKELGDGYDVFYPYE